MRLFKVGGPVLFLITLIACRTPAIAREMAPISATPTVARQDRLFLDTGSSPLVSIDPATGETSTWALDLAGADVEDWVPTGQLNVAVAHDGQHVAYATRKDWHPWELRLTDGRESRRVRSLHDFAWVADLAWSPDDEEIAFRGSYDDSSSGDKSFLAVMNIATGNLEFVSEPVYNFAWRSHSRQIVFSDAYTVASMGTYLVDEKRETFRRLRQHEYTHMLTVSPDGTVAAYTPNAESSMAVLNLDNGTRKEIAANAAWGPFGWSPEGEKIVVVRDESEVPCKNGSLLQGDLGIVDITNSQIAMLGRKAVGRPAWLPDGRSIAYVHVDSCAERTAALSILDVGSGTDEVLKGGLSRGTKIVSW